MSRLDAASQVAPAATRVMLRPSRSSTTTPRAPPPSSRATLGQRGCCPSPGVRSLPHVPPVGAFLLSLCQGPHSNSLTSPWPSV
jgi:hypothetical protein